MVAQRKPANESRWTYWDVKYGDLVRDPKFNELRAAHLAEMFPPSMGRPIKIDHARYSQLCALDFLKIIVARLDHEIVGYASYLVMPTLHHGPTWIAAINDATYLEPKHRKGMAAQQMLRQAEKWLRKQGVSVIYHHDPHRRSVAKVFARLGYTPVQTTYEKVLAGELAISDE